MKRFSPQPLPIAIGAVCLLWALTATFALIAERKASPEIDPSTPVVAHERTTTRVAAPTPQIVSTGSTPAIDGAVAPDDRPSRPEDLARISALEAQLSDSLRKIEWLEQHTTNQPPQRRFSGWMERLKEEDPERYAEIMKEREDARKESRHALAETAAYHLQSADIERTEEEQAEYDAMISLLNHTWELAEKLQDDSVPRSERRTLGRQMFMNMMQLDPLLESERERELQRMGVSMGYTEEEAEWFSGEIDQLIERTSVQSFVRPMMQRHRRPPDTSKDE